MRRKSTFLKLLYRFVDPTEGSVRIDGQDLRQLKSESFRRFVGVIPQVWKCCFSFCPIVACANAKELSTLPLTRVRKHLDGAFVLPLHACTGMRL